MNINLINSRIMRSSNQKILAVLLIWCFGLLSGIMSSTPAVIEYSCQKMVIISSTYFICGINEVMGGALRGMGRPIIPTVTTFIFMCVLRFIWVYAIFPLLPNLTFLYLVWPIGWVLSIVVLLIAYYYTIIALLLLLKYTVFAQIGYFPQFRAQIGKLSIKRT